MHLAHPIAQERESDATGHGLDTVVGLMLQTLHVLAAHISLVPFRMNHAFLVIQCHMKPDASKLNLKMMSFEASITTLTFSVSVAHVTCVYMFLDFC